MSYIYELIFQPKNNNNGAKNEMEMNSLDLLGFLWKNRKSILIIGFIAAVVSSFVALVIEEKFESTVTLYPFKTSSVSFGEIIMRTKQFLNLGRRRSRTDASNSRIC